MEGSRVKVKLLHVFGAEQLGALKPTPSPVGFGTRGVVSTNVRGPLLVLSVPDEGDGPAAWAAEQSIARKTAAKQRVEGIRTRRLRVADLRAVFFRMGIWFRIESEMG